jgi:CRISPR-associated protein Cmr2
MSNYLFALTITPVQSFITQARKTKDLFAGSEILSTLMKEVRDKFDKDKIVFPKNRKFVSNKIVAEIDKEPQKFGNELEEFINNKFYIIGSQTLLKKDGVPINMKLFEEHFKPQLCNFFQVFWVAVEYDKDKDKYQESYRKLEQNLGAIKNLRVFNQFEQISGRKCSVCGERNGLVYNSKNKPRYIIESAIEIESNLIQSNETLCAVCFTKRFYQGNFPSLAKITLLDWLNNVDYNDLKENLKNFDEELFFEDNLNDKYLEKVEVDKKAIFLIKKFIEKNNLKIKEQKKYYALIQFDIDSLGKTLSDLDKERQKKLSKELAEFAKKVSDEVLTSKKGQTIYAGGDDFLGFVNLNYLFDVIIDIQKAFEETVKKEFSNLTYSIGIIIAHYKEPLHISSSRVRKLLILAKNIDNKKNGLTFSVLKHSGEIVETTFKNTIENISKLSKIMELIENDFSDKFIINLELEFRSLVDEDEKLIVAKDILKLELHRLIKRALIDKEETKKVEELYMLLESFIEHRKINHFFHLLNIARFFKRNLK